MWGSVKAIPCEYHPLLIVQRGVRVTAEAAQVVEAGPRSAGIYGWALPLMAVTVLAAVLRFWGLKSPELMIFDEIFYAPDGCRYVADLAFFCGEGEFTLAHPPVGKWLIAAGTWWYGPTALGARVASAIFGSLSVAVLYLIARKLYASVVVALAAAGLLAIDFLHLVNSRAALLEVSVGFFILLAFLFYLYDRDASLSEGGRLLTGAADRPTFSRDVNVKGLRWRWRLLMGIALGLAVGSKWTAVPVILGIAVLMLLESRKSDPSRRFRQTLRNEMGSLLLFLVLVPFVVYAVTFVGRLPGGFLVAPWSDASWFRQFVERQVSMFDYHFALRRLFSWASNHQYASPAWSWPLLQRPVTYSFAIRDGHYRHIIALGNPLVWWPALAATLYAITCVVRRSEHRAGFLIPLVGLASTYGYWLLLTPRLSDVFLYYFGTAVPFLCLLVAGAMAKLARATGARVLLAGYTAAAAGVFVFFWPVLTWAPLTPDEWRSRMWFSDCSYREPPGTPGAGIRFPVVTEAPPPEETIVLPGNAMPDEHLPTQTEGDGWCWR